MEEVADLLIELPALPGLVAGLLELLQHWIDKVAVTLIELRTLLAEAQSSLEALQGWLYELRSLPKPQQDRILRKKRYALFLFLQNKARNTVLRQRIITSYGNIITPRLNCGATRLPMER